MPKNINGSADRRLGRVKHGELNMDKAEVKCVPDLAVHTPLCDENVVPPGDKQPDAEKRPGQMVDHQLIGTQVSCY